MYRLPPSTLLAGLLGTVLLTAACGNDAGAPQPAGTAPPTTGAPRPASTAPPATAPGTTGQPQAGADRYTAVPKCNLFPQSLAGTFQGSVLQITPEKKEGDTWTTGAACVAMMAKPQQPLSIQVYLFQAGPTGQGSTQAAAYAKAKAPAGEAVAGWGDEAQWSAGSCQLTLRSSNVVALFKQLSPTPTCRADVEPIARAFTGLHLT